MRPAWACLVLAVVLSITAGLASGQYIRCFVQDYALEETFGNPTEFTYVATIDVLSAAPVLLSFDEISFGPVLSDGCPEHARRDALQFFWSDLPGFAAPFAVFPVDCDDRKPLEFGISTVSPNRWGTKSRNVRDGTVFRPQMGHASMLSGIYTPRQATARVRPLMIRMRSLRIPERKLRVRSCVRTEDVPYDMPLNAYEVGVPRLLPIAECVFERGGWCSTRLGYINSAGGQLQIKYDSKANRLMPGKMENGFAMPSEFNEGIHMPNSISPALHVVWPCDNPDEPEHAEWRLDGLMLFLQNKDWLCNDGLTSSVLDDGVDTETEDKRHLSGYQAKPYVHKKLKKQVVRHKLIANINYLQAEKHFKAAGIVAYQYSTVARDAHIYAMALARGQATEASLTYYLNNKTAL